MKNYTYAVAYIMITLFAAHIFMHDAYRWQVNSISQLGAQGYDNAWIIRYGFIGFGLMISMTGISRIKRSKKFWLREAMIIIYGLAILLSGIFSAEPFLEGVPYSTQEAQLHGLFATLAGFALTTAILVFTLTDDPPPRRIAHFIALVLVTAFSLLFGTSANAAGLMQRLLWVAGFAWLVYLDFKPAPVHDIPASATTNT